MTGLACVFLLVLLAAAFFGLVSNEAAIETDATGNVVMVPAGDETATNEGTEQEAPKEPLAELGVTPGNTPQEDPAANGVAPN